MRRAVAEGRRRAAAGAAMVRDASPASRAQAATAAALVVAVFAAFAYGAATDPGASDAAARGSAALVTGTSAPSGRDNAAERSRATGLGGGRSGALRTLGKSQHRHLAPLPRARRVGQLPLAGRPRQHRHARRHAPQSPAHHGPAAPAPAPAPNTPPAGDTPVVVGLIYQPASLTARLATALGLADAPGDQAGQARAVAAWITAHGGITARPVVILAVPLDRTAGAPFAQACNALVADTLQPVAVIARADDAAEQTGCLAAHGLTLVGDGPAAGDSEVMANAGDHFFAPGSMALDRLARGYVKELGRNRFFAAGTRVGVLRSDAPMFERADRMALRPALAAAGATVVAQAALPAPRAIADAPAVLAGAATAALRFRLARVDRVVGLDDGVTTALFMRAAAAIGYRPRYGVNSTMAPAALPGRVARGQLQGAIGVGFAPLLDVAGDREPATVPATRRRCEAIYREARVPVGGRTTSGEYAAMSVCDALLAIRAALAGAPEATAGAVPRALAALGTQQPSALALASRLGNDRHDGAAAVRPLRFDDACGCMEYWGSEEVVP